MLTLRPTDALLVIDLQNDFCPAREGAAGVTIGGALAVAGGDEIVPLVNALGRRFEHVILTQDWHPQGHVSFASSHPGMRPYEEIAAPYGLPGQMQRLWPDHCVQGTADAELHPGLDLPHAELLVRKGFRREIDSYSAFVENDHRTPTGLAGYLRERGLTRLFLCGLAYDFCVRFSAVDGAALGFECVVIEDATRAVDLPGSIDATNDALAQSSVLRVPASQI